MEQGDKFNFYTFVEDDQSRKGSYGIFKCDCGTVKSVRKSAVKSGNTKSCGCHRKNQAKRNGLKAKTHGKTGSPIYKLWIMIKQYCNPNCKEYRGYTICEEWKDFNNFYKWIKDKWESDLSIVIINGNEYGPNTCILMPTNQYKGMKRKGKGIKHGLTNHPLFGVWTRMIAKCTNPDYHRYEPGLEIYQPWKTDFKTFYDWCVENGWQKGLVFSRINDSINRYSPDNCHFMHPREHRLKYQEKAEQTNIQKFGFPHPMQNNNFRDRIQEIFIDKYGKPYPRPASKTEKHIKNWLKSLGFEFESNVDILDGQEIDLYNNNLKLGIEYCGLYWHCEDSPEPRDRKYHYNKYIRCKKKGINLITIFGDEWRYKEKQVKSFIKSKLGIFDRKIYARNCTVSKISKHDGNKLLHQFHIQGVSKRSKQMFGISYDGEILGVVSFSLHHRDSSKLCLDRLCFKGGISITGGSSKLIKNATKHFNRKYDSVVTWSDNRWSSGNVYKKCGFILDGELPPDYSYVEMSNPRIRKSKQSMKKSNINCPDDMTEKQYCKQLGYSRIWDCGKKRWVIYI